jgi:hypothetical protein
MQTRRGSGDAFQRGLCGFGGVLMGKTRFLGDFTYKNGVFDGKIEVLGVFYI